MTSKPRILGNIPLFCQLTAFLFIPSALVKTNQHKFRVRKKKRPKTLQGGAAQNAPSLHTVVNAADNSIRVILTNMSFLKLLKSHPPCPYISHASPKQYTHVYCMCTLPRQTSSSSSSSSSLSLAQKEDMTFSVVTAGSGRPCRPSARVNTPAT